MTLCKETLNFVHHRYKEPPVQFRMCPCVFPCVSFRVEVQVLAMTPKAPLEVPTPPTPETTPMAHLPLLSAGLASSLCSNHLPPLHLLFPQPEMLSPSKIDQICDLKTHKHESRRRVRDHRNHQARDKQLFPEALLSDKSV